MDIDFMKSEAEDPMEVMFSQMEKLPDFSGSYADLNGFWMANDSSYLVEGIQSSSPPLIGSGISFSGGANHEVSPPFLYPSTAEEISGTSAASHKRNSMAAMREMIFRIAAMQPINIDPESVKPPKRRNVKISTDPQSVAARHRRERISERIRILQRLVPGGTKMDTASMLDEAIHYVKFLKNQVQSLERVAATRPAAAGIGFPVPMTSGSYFPVAAAKGYQHHQSSPGSC